MNNDVLLEIINNLDADKIFILNDKIKINVTVDHNILKDQLLFYYQIKSYLYDEIKTAGVDLTDYLTNSSLNDLLSDMKKIINNINLDQMEIKLKLELVYFESNLSFIKEIYDNKSLIHLIKTNNNIITSSFKLENKDNILFYNGIYKIKVIENKIIYQENKFEQRELLIREYIVTLFLKYQ